MDWSAHSRQTLDGPLWERGRRRPGPSRSGYDPFHPRLDPLGEDPPKQPLAFKRRALDYWGGETFHLRNERNPELLRRMRGRRSKRRHTIRAMTQPRAFKRGDRTEEHHRFAKWLIVHADARTGLVGVWERPNECRPLRLEELAERLGFSVDQMSRVIDDFVSAGWLFRHQGRDFDEKRLRWVGQVATTRVLKAFWERCGAQGMRSQFLERMKKREERRKLRAEQLERRLGAPPSADPLPTSIVGVRALKDYVKGLPLWGDPPDPPHKH